MNNELFATVAVGKILAGYPVDAVVDDISSHLGENSSDIYLHVQSLRQIHVNLNGRWLFCRKDDFFQYPAVVDAHFIQEIFKILEINMEEYRCSDVILRTTGLVSFKNVGTGFQTEWEVLLDNICIGKIRETGSFYDRNSDIILYINSSSSSKSGE